MKEEQEAKRWVLAPQPSQKELERIRSYMKKDGRLFSEPLARLLLQRGVDEDRVRPFFLPSFDQLHDPFSMKDMERAVERLTEAVFGEERIMLLGDYDVDGTTAVAMTLHILRSFGKEPLVHIPDRYEEGYGVSFRAVERAKEEAVGLLITLDCGIKGHEPLERAREAGVDTIVCDHHRPGDSLPPAHAVLDPQRSDDDYPFEGLSGCGVAFKLFQAFYLQQELDLRKLDPYLDLLAISIAADIVPMSDENRILTHFGLERIQNAPRPGIRELKKRAGIESSTLSVTDLVFTLGPRINAAGRMESGERAVELLVAEDEEAVKGSERLDAYNHTRRSLDQRISKEALARIREGPAEEAAHTSVVHDPDWHKGVIGIVASRLLEHYYRPTIVLSGSGKEVTGSARSVKGFDIHKAISNCSQYLERFGGHRYAAGLTLDERELPAFRQAFEEEVARSISPVSLVPEQLVDVELPFKRIGPRFFKTLQRFGPFGPENMQPLFLARNVKAASVQGVGKEKAHLKLQLYQLEDEGSCFPAIAFGFGSQYLPILEGEPFHILYHIEMNEFKGKKNLQLRITDLCFGDPESVITSKDEEENSFVG